VASPPLAYPTGYYRPQTPEGLKYAAVGFLLAGFGGLAGGAITLSLLSSPFGAMQIVSGLVTGLLGFIGLVFYLMGFYYLHSGRAEFGPPHESGMTRALWALIAAVVLVVASMIFVGGLALLADIGGGSAVTYLVAGLVAGIASQIAVALAVILPLRSLLPAERLPILLFTAVLFVLSPVVTYGVGLATFGPGDLLPPVASAAGDLYNVLPFVVATILYLQAKGRIDRGELKALPPRVVLYPLYAPPYPAMVPYAPPYPYNPYPNQPPPYAMYPAAPYPYAYPPPVPYPPYPAVQPPPAAPPQAAPATPAPDAPETRPSSEEKPPDASVLPAKREEEKAA
jgi:hypothetical protein